MIVDVDGVARELPIEAVIVAGYTGRDRAAVMHHIEELAEIGVPPPASVPFYWRFPPWLATANERVVVAGAGTSGEAEVCLLIDGDEIFVTVASDHTDRVAEAVDIGMSKAICPKPIASTAWRAADIGGRWGELELRSWIVERGAPSTDPASEMSTGAEVAYQHGRCASLVSPPELLAGLPFRRPRCFALLTGTVPAIGGVRPASRFRAELHDPGTGRCIPLCYRVEALDDGPSLPEEES